MDMDLLRSGTISLTSEKVLWFEFLLDPTLLEKHLKKDNPDPGPIHLIVQFASNIPATQNDAHSADGDSEKVPESKKTLALKVMALKTAAFLKWDLALLVNKLPTPIQMTLMQDLLGLMADDKTEADTSSCSDEVLFATTLYHRWLLYAVTGARMPQKHQRTSVVPVPGCQDPSVVAPGVAEEILRNLESQAEEAVAFLSRAVAENRSVRVPLMECFLPLTEDSPEVKYNWEKIYVVEANELGCQIHFDLGKYHFFQQNYALAREHLSESRVLLGKLKKSLQYCMVNPVTLEGLCRACGLVASGGDQPSLLAQFHQACANHYMGLLPILQTDNVRREIPLVYRDVLELDIQGALSSGKFTVARDFSLQVQALNAVRHALEDPPAPLCGDFMQRLHMEDPKATDILIM